MIVSQTFASTASTISEMIFIPERNGQSDKQSGVQRSYARHVPSDVGFCEREPGRYNELIYNDRTNAIQSRNHILKSRYEIYTPAPILFVDYIFICNNYIIYLDVS